MSNQTMPASVPHGASTLFTYRNVPVHAGPDGLVDAKDMHAAASAPNKKNPKSFLRTATAKAFLASLGKGENIHLLRIEPGRNGGTWMCRELAVFYAAYLDADFAVFVTRVFLAAGDGKLAPAPMGVESQASAVIAELKAEREALVDIVATTRGLIIRQGAKLERAERVLAEAEERYSRPRASAETRRLHAWILRDTRGGMCPCCTSEDLLQTDIIDAKGRRTVRLKRGVHVSIFPRINSAELDFTWPICRKCHHRLRDKHFHHRKFTAFQSYQTDALEWLADNKPDLWLKKRG